MTNYWQRRYEISIVVALTLLLSIAILWTMVVPHFHTLPLRLERGNEPFIQLAAQYEWTYNWLCPVLEGYRKDHAGRLPNSLSNLISEGYVTISGNHLTNKSHRFGELPLDAWRALIYIQPGAIETNGSIVIYLWLDKTKPTMGWDAAAITIEGGTLGMTPLTRDELDEQLRKQAINRGSQ